MKIDGDGFVIMALPNLSETVPKADKDRHSLLLELINFAEIFKHDLKVRGQETPEEQQQIFVLIVFIRLLEIVEAIAILAAYGIKEELRSLFRVFLDAYFIFVNCCNDADFIPMFVNSSERARLTFMNAASQHKSELFKELNEYATTQVKADLKAKIKAKGIQPFRSEEYAKKVGCEEIYNSLYRICSSAIHTTPKCLGNYINVDKKGNVIRINHSADSDTTDQVVYDTAYFLINSLNELSKIFGLDRQKELDAFGERLGEIASTIDVNGTVPDESTGCSG